jgi:hypothetical protein
MCVHDLCVHIVWMCVCMCVHALVCIFCVRVYMSVHVCVYTLCVHVFDHLAA